MDEQATYTVENELATLTLANAAGTLKCQLPEELLNTFNSGILKEGNLPKFEEWFDKNQDFGWLFRVVFYMQIQSALRYETAPQDIQNTLQSMDDVVVKELQKHGISEIEMKLFRYTLWWYNRCHGLNLFKPDEVIKHWEELKGFFDLSYQI
jgi:hypothetical protein